MRMIKKPVAAVAAGALLLGSCSGDPFTLFLQKVDETSPQAPATIELSAPQLYSRERLINDRATEEDYLKTLMDASVDVQFTPALQRDLASVSSLFLSIAAQFNPIAGAQAGRKEALDQEQFDIDKVKFETAMTKAKQELAAQQAKTDVAAPDSAGTPTASPSLNPQVLEKNPTPEQMQKQVEALTTAVNALNAAYAKLTAASTTKAGLSDVKATPQEIFEDRQAYRSQLRSALEQSRLDDRHDLNGNTLFRLQYHATVLPGKVKNRYGVARVTILPRELTNREIYTLYRDWLAAITAELNQSDKEAQIALERYSALGSATGMFEVVKMPFGDAACHTAVKNNDGAQAATLCAFIPVALPSSLVAEQELLRNKDLHWGEQFDALQAFYEALRTQSNTPEGVASMITLTPDPAPTDPADKNNCSRSWDDTPKGGQTLSALLAAAGVQADGVSPTLKMVDMVHHAQRVIALQQIVGLALTKRRYGGNGDLGTIGNNAEAKKDFVETVEALQGWSNASFNFFDMVDIVNTKKKTGCKEYLRPGFTPRTFRDAVRGKTAAVDSFAYSTGPSVLAQRVSTVASATEALQVMASVAAVLPTAGTSIDAAANYMHSATGKVQALESVPLVMGFSDSGSPADPTPTEQQSDVAEAQHAAFNTPQSRNTAKFGWVFGPKAVVNPSNSTIELRQVPFNEEVTADVSVPGWWPSIRLEIQTAWIQNFYDGVIADQSEEKVSTRIVEVPLSATQQRLDRLTEFVSNAVWGQQPAPILITSVQPTTLSACGTSSVIIRGPNLWRGGEVYLNGRKSDGPIHVLPDMMGIVANFKFGSSAQGAPETGKLQVFTQLGTDSKTVMFDKTGCNSGPAGTGAVPIVTAKSLAIWPTQAMEVNGSDDWPEASKLTVRLFPQGEPNSKAAVEIADVLRAGPTLHVAVPAIPAAAGLPTGAPFEGSVIYSDAGQKREIARIAPLYFYKQKSDTDLTLQGSIQPTTVTKAQLDDAASEVGITIKLKFPERFQAANPDIISQGLRLVLRDPIENEIQSVNVAAPADGALRDLAVSFKLDKPRAVSVVAAATADVSIKFKLMAGSGANATEITAPAAPVLTLKKQ